MICFTNFVSGENLQPLCILENEEKRTLVLHLARFMVFCVSRVRPEKAINCAPNGTRFVEKLSIQTHGRRRANYYVSARFSAAGRRPIFVWPQITRTSPDASRLIYAACHFFALASSIWSLILRHGVTSHAQLAGVCAWGERNCCWNWFNVLRSIERIYAVHVFKSPLHFCDVFVPRCLRQVMKRFAQRCLLTLALIGIVF